MKINKVFRYFLKQNKKSYKDISLWLASPYHNQEQDVVILWEYLCANPPKSEDASIDKKVFFANIFPNQPYNEPRLNKAMFHLSQQFVCYAKYQFAMKSAIGQIEFANELSYNNKYVEDMIPLLKKVEIELQEERIYSIDYYYAWYFLRKTQIYSQTFGDVKNIATITKRLAQSIESLDVFYLTAQLKHHLLFIVNRALLTLNDDKFILVTSDLLNHIEKKEFIIDENPLLKAYYLCLKTYYSHSEKDLDRLLAVYEEDVITHFSENDKMQITGSIWHVIRLNQAPDIKKKELEFLLKGIELKIIFDKGKEGYIRAATIYNIIRLGIEVYGVEWVENFIKIKDEDIDPDNKALIRLLAQSLICLYRGKTHYRKATKVMLMFAGTNNMTLNNHFHTLKLMILYKIVEYEGEDVMTEMSNALKTYKTFLKKDTTSQEQVKQTRLGFAKIISQLAKTSHKQKTKLAELAQASELLNHHEKAWLLNEIALKIAKI